MRILLIQPNYRRIYAYAQKKEITPVFPPLGLAYLAAVLKKNKIDVKILEGNAFDLNHNQIKKVINDYKPDIVGLTSTTSLIEEAHEVAKLCDKETPVILGGFMLVLCLKKL